MIVPVEDLLKIAEALFAGFLLGYERESLRKPAGLRTMILITVGSTLFSILSSSNTVDSPDRIASNIVTGVGFVGAGVIFKDGLDVKGITTAATIWAAAAIGMAIGFGNYWLAGGTLVLTLMTLTIMLKFEKTLESSERKNTYEITFEVDKYSRDELEKSIAQFGIELSEEKLLKNKDEITIQFSTTSLKEKLLALDNFLVSHHSLKSIMVKAG